MDKTIKACKESIHRSVTVQHNTCTLILRVNNIIKEKNTSKTTFGIYLYEKV